MANRIGGRSCRSREPRKWETIYDGWDLNRIWDVVYHSILPASSIILSQIGFWALGMRGMMITTAGEDYVTLAQMRGLTTGSHLRSIRHEKTRSCRSWTSLALAMSLIVSGVILVEYIFPVPRNGLVCCSTRSLDSTTSSSTVWCWC